MQNATCRILTVLTIVLCSEFLAWASFLPVSTDQHIDHSSAVFHAAVRNLQTFEERGVIYTRALLKVRESFKGKLPDQVEVLYRGGQIGGRGQTRCGAPQLKIGDDRIFFVSMDPQGNLFLEGGELGAVRAKTGDVDNKLLGELRALAERGPMAGADLTSHEVSTAAWASAEAVVEGPRFAQSTATNLVTGGDGLPARSLQPDSGRGIPYLIDADYLPTGITLSQAVWAVSSALSVWTNVSSARFEFAGFQSFGQAAEAVEADDGVLRIQLHDHYNSINGSSELGVGGSGWVLQNSPSGWTTGGRVVGNDFHAVTHAFVMMEHGQASLRNLATFTEVLTHEIGHTLGLGHSSQNNPEPISLLKEATMFWLVHGDGRGATLNAWDINVCRQIHPLNTPPVCFSRYLDVITGSALPSLPGLNSAQVPMYDLQNTSLTFAAADGTTVNGSFTVASNTVTFVSDAPFSDAERLDPASGSSYDRIFARCSDGVNASPWALVSVLSFNFDSYAQGVPDWWRTTWFGSANPEAAPNRSANEDFDNDGFSNRTEWLLGSDPTLRASNLRITSVSRTNLQFQARAAEVYEVLRSTNLANWTPIPFAFKAQGDTASVPFINNGTREFFRVRRVP